MHAHHVRLIASGVLLGGLIAPALARAQSIGSPTVSATSQIYPQRFVGGVLQNVRPQNLNPTGINYSDCASDMFLQYSVGVQGFNGQELEVWISATSDCTNDMNRGNGLNPTCWQVFGTTINKPAFTTLQISVPVRAIVGPLGRVPSPTGLVGDQPITACQSQTSPTAVQFTVFILPVQAPATYTGTGFMQALTVDMVGPPAPSVNAPGIGDTFITAGWTANSDADTVGYDVFVEQVNVSDAASSEAASFDAASTLQLVCDDSGSATGDDGGDASSDGATASVDASCHLINVGAGPMNSSSSTSCTSSVLSGTVNPEAGTSTTNSTTATEDGAVTDAGVVEGPGGVSTIPCNDLRGGSCQSGAPAYTSTSLTVSGEGHNTFQITGLTDGVTYNYVVSAVDAFGNPGPPSSVQCGEPAKVKDFFTVYREAGGGAGGGFCALDVVGERSETSLALAGLGLGAALFARRRRRPC